jgi:hypothetical protein
MDAPQHRPLLSWLIYGATAVLVLGAILLFRHSGGLVNPFPAPPKNDTGPPSMVDDYLTLRTKADAWHKPQLHQYLESLDNKNGDHWVTGQALDHGPIVLKWVKAVRHRFFHPMIHVPGDLNLSVLDWNSATNQVVPLTDGWGTVEITPEVLKGLAQRRQKLIALGVSEAPPPQ